MKKSIICITLAAISSGIAGAALAQQKPEEVIRHAVKGMLPHTPLGRKIFKKLRVYRGSVYPQSKQKGLQPLSL